MQLLAVLAPQRDLVEGQRALGVPEGPRVAPSRHQRLPRLSSASTSSVPSFGCAPTPTTYLAVRLECVTGSLTSACSYTCLKLLSCARATGLTGGHVRVLSTNPKHPIVAYHRFNTTGPGDDVLVLVNMSSVAFTSYKIGAPRPGLWRVRIDTHAACTSGDARRDVVATSESRDGLLFSVDVPIQAFSAVILSQDPLP